MATVLTRSARWVRAELPFALVVGAVLAATVYLVLFPGHWRRGSAVIGLALLAAGVLRLTLPPARVGMLGVRGRWFDALCYFGLGVVILAVDIRLH